MSNKPAWHNLFMTFFVSSNILLNYFFIPNYGIYGAAIATTISILFSTLLIKSIHEKNIKNKDLKVKCYGIFINNTFWPIDMKIFKFIKYRKNF